MASGTGSFSYDVTAAASIQGTGTFSYSVTAANVAPSSSGDGTFTYSVTDSLALPSASGSGPFTYTVSTPANNLNRIVNGQVKHADLYRIVRGRKVRQSLYHIVNGKSIRITGPIPNLSVVTRFGACPEPGKTTADIITKYGQKSFTRIFLGVPSGTPPNKTVGASGAHISWSLGGVNSGFTNYQNFVNGNMDAAMIATLQGLDPHYFFVEALHEVDNKVNDASNPLPVSLGQQVKNKFYDLVKSVNPKLRVVNTLTGYAFSVNNSLYTSGQIDTRYGVIKADVIGLDVDGIHSYPYPVMDNRAVNAQKFIADHAAYGYTDYAFPEWGTSVKQAADQPDLVGLADWITKYGLQWKASPRPPLFACWYDYYNAEDPNVETRNSDQLTVAAPINALKALIASSVTSVEAPANSNNVSSNVSSNV